MGIFGKLDAENVSTNPFFIEAGEYEAEVTKAEYKTNRDNNKQLHIEYTITDETSQFNGAKAVQYFTLPPDDMTNESMALLPVDEQKSIRRTMSAIKRTLCGNSGNVNQKGLGVPADDLNDENWKPEVVVGTKVNLAISNFGANNEGVNIKWVNLNEDAE